MFLVLPGVALAQDDMSMDEADTVVVRHIRKTTKKEEAVREISGKVISAQGKQPLAGVLVQSIVGDGYSTLTDENGDFTMKVPLYCSAINVTLPGYNTVRVGLNRSGQLNDIVLHSEAAPALYSADDNIMNVVTAKDFDYSNAVNIASEIQNRLGADVLTSQRSGLSGAGSYMQIGGVGSYLTNAQPLIVIDGVITDISLWVQGCQRRHRHQNKAL